jgi:hypothetical protein
MAVQEVDCGIRKSGFTSGTPPTWRVLCEACICFSPCFAILNHYRRLFRAHKNVNDSVLLFLICSYRFLLATDCDSDLDLDQKSRLWATVLGQDH